MEPVTIALLAAAGVVVLLVLAGVLVRRRRERALTPVRLGPRWEPQARGELAGPTVDPEAREQRAETIRARTDLDRETVDTVLAAWDEYLAVIGLGELPPGHRYRVFDPYDPPIPERGPSGPVTDPVRVARDVERRTGVSEADAMAVLQALHDTPEGPSAA